jgi:Domain of unknown function (DUF4189)
MFLPDTTRRPPADTRLERYRLELNEDGLLMDGDRRTDLTIMLVIALLALAGLAYWKLVAKPQLGPYGGIAMSDTSLTYGGAWGYPDPISAYKRSIAECNKASGGNDCVVKVTLKENCGALAISVEHNASFLVQGRDQVGATSTAMAQCQASGATDCSIHENICSSDS